MSAACRLCGHGPADTPTGEDAPLSECGIPYGPMHTDDQGALCSPCYLGGIVDDALYHAECDRLGVPQ